MTVQELIDLLGDYDPNFTVVLALDSEGNAFSPLCELGGSVYVPESSWGGYILAEEDEDDDPLVNNAVVLWPVN